MPVWVVRAIGEAGSAVIDLVCRLKDCSDLDGSVYRLGMGVALREGVKKPLIDERATGQITVLRDPRTFAAFIGVEFGEGGKDGLIYLNEGEVDVTRPSRETLSWILREARSICEIL